MRRAIFDSAMRPVVIVLLDPTGDAGASLFQAPILRRPHFFFLQAAMEPFDVAVALGMVVSRAPAGGTALRLCKAVATMNSCRTLPFCQLRLRPLVQLHYSDFSDKATWLELDVTVDRTPITALQRTQSGATRRRRTCSRTCHSKSRRWRLPSQGCRR